MPRVPETISLTEEGLKEIIQEMDTKAKGPKGFQLAEFLERLRKPATKMISAGYSYSDISRLLKEKKIHIPAAIIQSSIEGSEKDTEVDEMEKPEKKTRKKQARSSEFSDVSEAPITEKEVLDTVKVAQANQGNGFNVVDKNSL